MLSRQLEQAKEEWVKEHQHTTYGGIGGFLTGLLAPEPPKFEDSPTAIHLQSRLDEVEFIKSAGFADIFVGDPRPHHMVHGHGIEDATFDTIDAVTLVSGLVKASGRFAGRQLLKSFTARTAKRTITNGLIDGISSELADDIAKHIDDLGELRKVIGPLIKCFSRDTLVATPTGHTPIGQIQVGDMVKSFCFQTGQWKVRRVLDRIDNSYQGAVVTIRAGESTFETTVNHPVWVITGHDLDLRPTPLGFSDVEDQNLSLQGRWVNSHQLVAGDRVINSDGVELTVDTVSQRYESSFPVSNLTIEEFHNFAVGLDSILVHNDSICDVGEQALIDMVQSGTSLRSLRSYILNHENGAAVYSRLSRRFKGQGLAPRFGAEQLDDIARFRQGAGLPVYDGTKEAGAVASVTVDGRSYFGVNTGFQPKGAPKRLYRKDAFEAIKDQFPWAKNWANVEFLKHAEAHALLRAARKGPLPKKITMYVDKPTCGWCQNQLESLMRHLGVEELTIFSGGSSIPIKLP